MKILHISDFHIVSEETLKHAIPFQKKLASMGIEFPLTVSSPSGRARFLDHLEANAASQFDAIIFSGDATSLGDNESLKEASLYLEQIREKALKKGLPKTNCIAIPGNHDVLDLGIRALLRQFNEQTGAVGGFLLKFIKGGKPDEFRSALTEFLKDLGTPDGMKDGKEISFRTLLRERFSRHFEPYACFPTGDDLLPVIIDGSCTSGDKIRLNVFPINTVPTRPQFVNMGMVTDEHLANIVNHANIMRASADGREVVNFSVSHHGLMALSAESVATSDRSEINLTAFLEHAISSQINGFKLGKALQGAGYDAHLHGHEHQNSLIRFDFDVENRGSIYSSGVDAAYDASGHAFAFSTIELPNPYCMTIKDFQFDRAGSQFKSSHSDVVFDSAKTPKSTELARKEIREFYYRNNNLDKDAVESKEKFAGACDELLLNSQKGIFIFGVRLDTMRLKLLRISRLPEEAPERKSLWARLKNLGLDILIVKPIMQEKSYALYDDKDMISDAGQLAKEWGEFIEELARNIELPHDLVRRNFRIRYTNTPLTHAGTCEVERSGAEYKLQPKFSRALIQTVKIVSVYGSEVFLDLNYRTNNGLLKYFAGSAWNLWSQAGELNQELK